MSGSVNRVILVGNLGKDPVCEKRDDDMATGSLSHWQHLRAGQIRQRASGNKGANGIRLSVLTNDLVRRSCVVAAKGCRS